MNIIVPPIISSFDIASDRISQTQIGPKTLSIRTSKLTSAAGTKGVPVVTRVIPSPIVNAPINKHKLRSYDEINNPCLKYIAAKSPIRLANTPPRKVPPRTFSLALYLAITSINAKNSEANNARKFPNVFPLIIPSFTIRATPKLAAIIVNQAILRGFSPNQSHAMMADKNGVTLNINNVEATDV